MNKICTSIEQSQKLIELGLDVNTADMMWDDWRLIDEGWKLNVGYYPEIEQDYGRKCYPAWSLGVLLENVLPKVIIVDNLSYVKSCDFSVEEDCWYLSYKDDYVTFNTLAVTTGESLLDAAFEMILKLYKQKLL